MIFQDQRLAPAGSQAIKQHIVRAGLPRRPRRQTDEGKIEAPFPKAVGRRHHQDRLRAGRVRPGRPTRRHARRSVAGKVHLVGYNGTVNPERILPRCSVPGAAGPARAVRHRPACRGHVHLHADGQHGNGHVTRDIYQAFFRKAAATRELIWASYAFGVVLTMAASRWLYTTSINDIGTGSSWA